MKLSLNLSDLTLFSIPAKTLKNFLIKTQHFTPHPEDAFLYTLHNGI